MTALNSPYLSFATACANIGEADTPENRQALATAISRIAGKRSASFGAFRKAPCPAVFASIHLLATQLPRKAPEHPESRWLAKCIGEAGELLLKTGFGKTQRELMAVVPSVQNVSRLPYKDD